MKSSHSTLFKELTTIEETVRVLSSHFTPQPKNYESVNLENAYKRVLAEDVTSKISVPQFNRAKKDGWAVKATDIKRASETNPIELEIIGNVKIGEESKIEAGSQEAAKITTGAMIPSGANTVVMVEYSEREDDKVRIFKSQPPRANIQERGSDIALGEIILRKGELLTSKEIGAIAAIGKHKIKVFQKPKVAIFSIGDELTSPRKALEFGKVYDINTYSLLSAVKAIGGEPIAHTRLKDKPHLVKNKLKKIRKKADLILTSGATSVGGGDFLPNVIHSLENSKILVHGIKIKPGKPTIIGKIEDTPYFGLPGHPVSCLTIFRELVDPIIRKMGGYPSSNMTQKKALMKSRIATPAGRKYLASVTLNEKEGKAIGVPTPGGSSTITHLLKADGYLPIPSEKEYQPKDKKVNIRLLTPQKRISDLTIAAKPSCILNIIHQLVHEKFPELSVKTFKVGNVRSITGVKKGEYTLGLINVFDIKSREFNFSFVKRFDPEKELFLTSGVSQEVGILFDNEKLQLEDPKELFNKEVNFLNRETQVGARQILDLKMQKLLEERGESHKKLHSMIRGYNNTALTNISIALGVSKKRIDAGLSTRYLAEKFELGFLHIGSVEIDFISKKNTRAANVCLQLLNSSKFKELVRKTPGISLQKKTGKRKTRE